MSIQVYAATTVEPLVKLLAKEIKNTKQSVFQSDYIVSDNKDTTDWLKEKIAEENGIAANLITCSAREMLSMVYKLIYGGDANKPVLNRLQQKWLLYELLNEPSFAEQFPKLADYYRDKPSYQLALAGKISNLFNQYSLYTPSKLEAWNTVGFETTEEEEAWQHYLWIAFQERIKPTFVDNYQLFQLIMAGLENSDKTAILKEKLPVVYLFNISGFNSYLLELFFKIGQVIEGLVFHESTIKEIKEVYTNDLVENLKGSASYILNAFKKENIAVTWLDAKEPKAKHTLLQSLQASILNDEVLSEQKEEDASLSINSCYSPIREVEVLYNYLVKSVDVSQNAIGARDIVVYCSDMAKYATDISAVFENAPYSFPYHIAGEKVQTLTSSIEALDAILQMDIKWMKPSLVMQLLEYPSIVERYGIKDVQLLRKLVREANIRNGFSGDIEKETNLISWQHGLKRLCYGMLLSGEEWFDDGEEEVFTLDRVEGNSAEDLIRFNYLIHNLHAFLMELKKDRTFADWVLFIHEAADLFFNREDDADLEPLTKELAGIVEIDSSKEKINFNAIYPILQKIFKSISTSYLWSSNKGIRFCAISNASPIPKTVVALLGLNLSDFPRQQNRLSYDLIQWKKESVLQDIKEKDKSFLLKAILSAKEQLYISYIGKSTKDNSDLPPSSLVDALLDYVNIEDLVKQHPLHNFNSIYFKNNKDYYSYLGENKGLEPLEAIFEDVKEAEVDKRKIVEIPLYELVNFFKDSFKNYYNKQLHIYYREENEVLEDAELFTLDTLQKWALKKRIVDAAELTPDAIRILKAHGSLPLGVYGEICLENVQKEVESLTKKISELKAGFTEEKTKINYEIEISEVLYKVKGQIDSVFVNDTERVHIYSNVSSSKQKYQLEAFIHLLLLGEKSPTRLDFLSLEKYRLNHISMNYSEEFKGVLDELIRIFVASKSAFNPFYISEEISKSLFSMESDTITKDIVETALAKDAYLSDYVGKEWETGYFAKEDNRIEFVNNYRLLQELVFKNFD